MAIIVVGKSMSVQSSEKVKEDAKNYIDDNVHDGEDRSARQI